MARRPNKSNRLGDVVVSCAYERNEHYAAVKLGRRWGVARSAERVTTFRVEEGRGFGFSEATSRAPYAVVSEAASEREALAKAARLNAALLTPITPFPALNPGEYEWVIAVQVSPKRYRLARTLNLNHRGFECEGARLTLEDALVAWRHEERRLAE